MTSEQQIIIDFPAKSKWINSLNMELALRASTDAHQCKAQKIVFYFPAGCKIMIDAAVRLLSLINQLDKCCKRVLLDFEEGEDGAMGYLNRMGFFDQLSSSIEVEPYKPFYSGAEIFRGTNTNLVEIARIHPDHCDADLPTRLSDALMSSCGNRTDANELEWAAWTIFTELIGNIFEHSETQLDGYASLQLYRGGNNLTVAVSDSGRGILDTLRPSLQTESPSLAKLSDVDLLVEIFRQGISRHGADRGCGLKGSAAKAIKFRTTLEVRLPTSSVVLVPSSSGYTPNTAYCYHSLPLIWGTHICFKFTLD